MPANVISRVPALALLAAIGLSPSTPLPAAAQTAAPAAQAGHLIVFNRPGPNWAQRESAAPVLRQHQNLYRRLAESGEIIFSGRFAGEPLLGMAVFRRGIDPAEIRRRLEEDPTIRMGLIALEFRPFAVSFGSLAVEPR